ncbi:MAG: hypothetical protein K0R24_311 [Gammaproteobacteria bacterium]|jgi:hypothetical protein|nr:hypothetical protein [Gammaproteobacteria bacterium]
MLSLIARLQPKYNTKFVRLQPKYYAAFIRLQPKSETLAIGSPGF